MRLSAAPDGWSESHLHAQPGISVQALRQVHATHRYLSVGTKVHKNEWCVCSYLYLRNPSNMRPAGCQLPCTRFTVQFLDRNERPSDVSFSGVHSASTCWTWHFCCSNSHRERSRALKHNVFHHVDTHGTNGTRRPPRSTDTDQQI